MTVQNPPVFLQAGSHPAEDVRRLFTTLTGDSEGVLSSADLLVSQSDTPAMSVKVSGGRAFILGDFTTYQGTYFVENRGDTTLTIAASDPVNDRIDLVVARVYDSVYSGSSNEWALEVITGTPAASPTVPATPNSAIPLAQVSVGNGVSSITTAVITDLRDYAYLRGGTLSVFTASHRPDSPPEGMLVYVQDEDVVYVYNGSRWLPVGVTYNAAQSGTPSTSTSYVSVPGCSITLPPGLWQLTGKLQWSVSTASARTYDAQLWNQSLASEIGFNTVGAGPTHDVRPTALVMAQLNNTVTYTLTLRARVSAVDGVQNAVGGHIRAESMLKLG